MPVRRTSSVSISAVISDVDGTLVTDDKFLTAQAKKAVAKLRDGGVAFTVISSRPPRGLRTLIDALEITLPIGCFNGGVIAHPDLSVVTEHLLQPAIARRAVAMLDQAGIQAWVFSGQDWLLREPSGPYVALERHTIGFDPKAVGDFGRALDSAAKIVGVSADFERLAGHERDITIALGGGANVVRSQPYYLDITHPLANKGVAIVEIAKRLAVSPAHIAVIGDGGNDVAMFERSGLSIAMGNASPQVRRAADLVTESNGKEGFAKAVDLILGGHLATADLRPEICA